MTNHKFKKLNYTRLCGTCFKPLLHEFHLDNLDENDMRESNLKTRATEYTPSEEMTLVDGVIVPWTGKKEVGLSIQGETPAPYKEHTGQLSFTQSIPKLDRGTSDSSPDCYGHICPECNKKWFHTYKCWPDPKVSEAMYCPVHFGQIISEIHRPSDLVNFISTSGNIPARELAEQRLQHKAFLILEWSNKQDYEDLCIAHIQNLRNMIQQFQNKILASREALVDLRKENGEKLTKEELIDYRKRAARQKKLVTEGEKEKKKKDWEMMLKSLMKAIPNENVAKEQLKQIYKSQGKEIPE